MKHSLHEKTAASALSKQFITAATQALNNSCSKKISNNPYMQWHLLFLCINKEKHIVFLLHTPDFLIMVMKYATPNNAL